MDTSKLIKVKVDRWHIAHGKATDCIECPIALAIREATGYDVSVSTGFIKVDGWWYNCDNAVGAWIGSFDRGGNVEPIIVALQAGQAWLHTENAIVGIR